MSIVAVHGPNMSGGTGAGGGGTGATITAPQVKATADMSNGRRFTFEATDKTRAAADYDWAFPPDGTPATATDSKGPITVTYGSAGNKIATLTVAAGAGPPAGGSYPITVVSKASAGPRSFAPPGDGEGEEELEPEGEFNPSDHTVAEVEEYVNEHPEEAQRILDAEEADKGRVTLISFLEALIAAE